MPLSDSLLRRAALLNSLWRDGVSYGAAYLDFKFCDQPWFAVVLLKSFNRVRGGFKQNFRLYFNCVSYAVSVDEGNHACRLRTESITAFMFHQ
jgi:hypothetical protein